ncbi:MAG: hypothetical protein IJD79_00155 [Clostridia bacterium]|nr:hypothetical protein [Clostridia bacterium]
MKKIVSVLLLLVLALSCTLVSCEKEEDINAKSEGVLTYAQYCDAALDSDVVIEGYVQGKQIYNTQYGNTSLYIQDGDGAYFVYRLACTQAEYDKIKVGGKVKISGTKSEWGGEVEIVDATCEVLTGEYIAKATDATAAFGNKDNLIKYQNQLVALKGLKVVASTKKDDTTEYAFLYNWDGSGEKGSDLYFNVSDGTTTYQFCVETDLCGKDTDVYKAVEALKVGATIDLEGFLFWYEGNPNPHVTKVTAK